MLLISRSGAIFIYEVFKMNDLKFIKLENSKEHEKFFL